MNESNGLPSLASAIVAMLGLLSATHPAWSLLVTLHAHSPELQTALPYILTMLGSVGAAIAHPPAWLRTPVLRAWEALRGVTPKANP